jgi:hypothetical protein
MNHEYRIIDAPADFSTRIEGIHRTSDREAERLPIEVDAYAELGLATLDAHVG